MPESMESREKQGETRTEYRVVGDTREGERSVACGGSLAAAKSRGEELAEGSRLIAPWTSVRIQKRTVTTTPWEDVTDE